MGLFTSSNNPSPAATTANPASPPTSPKKIKKTSPSTKEQKPPRQYDRRSDVQVHMDMLLHKAVVEESVDVVRFLLTNGAAPSKGARTDYDVTDEIVQARDAAWVDVIDLAASKSQTNTADAAAKVELLMNKAGYNGHVPPRWVDYAIRHEKIDALRAILTSKKYLRLPHAHCEHLHVAVDVDGKKNKGTKMVNLEILELLIVQAGDDVNKIPKAGRPYAGEAPIHVATRRGSVEAVQFLRQHGANVDRKGKNFGRTVRWLQVKEHSCSCCQ